jgi:hypothetical protein
VVAEDSSVAAAGHVLHQPRQREVEQRGTQRTIADQHFEKYLRLVELVATIRIVVYDRHLDAADQMCRIRDAFGVYDGILDAEDC